MDAVVARLVLVQIHVRIAAAERAVADVEQELDERRIGGLHQQVPRHVALRRLDELDLVVVISELEAGGLRALAVLVQLVRHALPVVARAQPRPRRADDRLQSQRVRVGDRLIEPIGERLVRPERVREREAVRR